MVHAGTPDETAGAVTGKVNFAPDADGDPLTYTVTDPPEGGTVTVEDLVAKGAVRKGQPVKVLGNGEIDVKLEIAVDRVSASAKEKILAAGGTVSEA